MKIDFVNTIFLIIGIYIIGFAFLNLLNISKKMNVFLKSSLAFLFGNIWTVYVLSILAFFELLDYSLVIFLLVVLISVIFLIYLLVQNKYRINLNIRKSDFVIILLLLIGFSYLIFPSLLSPMKMWDSVAMWLMKGKVFFIENGFKNSFFLSPYFTYTHKDYPNGFPLLLSMFFRLYGQVNEQAIQIFLFSFFANIVIAWIGVCKKLFRKINLLTIMSSVLALFLTGKLLEHSVSGYAEVPLIFGFMISSILFLMLILEKKTKNFLVFFVLTIFSVFWGVNIKNEGLAFAGIILIFANIIFVVKFRLKEILVMMKSYKKLIAGSIFGVSLLTVQYLGWINLKRSMNFETDIFTKHIDITVDLLLTRIEQIYVSWFNMVVSTSFWGILFIPMLLIFVAITLVLLIHKKTFIYSIPGLALFAQFFIYLYIYLTTPNPLDWHLATSLDRITMHLIPSMYVIVAFYINRLSYFQKKVSLSMKSDLEVVTETEKLNESILW